MLGFKFVRTEGKIISKWFSETHPVHFGLKQVTSFAFHVLDTQRHWSALPSLCSELFHQGTCPLLQPLLGITLVGLAPTGNRVCLYRTVCMLATCTMHLTHTCMHIHTYIHSHSHVNHLSIYLRLPFSTAASAKGRP